MLSPGKHVTRDIPRLVQEAGVPFPHVACRVTPAFGVNEKLAEVIASRAGVEILNPIAAADACRCREPNGVMGACGPACAARATAAPVLSPT
jgi:sirohydrochlorin ferrochelatase